MSCLATEMPKGSSAPGVGSKLRAEPSREDKGKAKSCSRWGQLAWDGDGAELWGFSQRGEGEDAVGWRWCAGSPWEPNAPVQPHGTFCPPPPAPRWSGTPSGSGSPYPSQRRPQPAKGQRESAGGSPQNTAWWLSTAQSIGPALREEQSPPARRWTDATSSAEPSSAAPPGLGWP